MVEGRAAQDKESVVFCGQDSLRTESLCSTLLLCQVTAVQGGRAGQVSTLVERYSDERAEMSMLNLSRRICRGTVKCVSAGGREDVSA